MSRLRQDASLKIRTYGLTLNADQIMLPQTPDWHQLIYASRGVLTVHTTRNSWVVPSHRALWVPANVKYRIELFGPVALRTLYVSVGVSRALPRDSCVVNVSPLLRELILHAIKHGALDRRVPVQARLIGVILDQIETLRSIPMQLPNPRDARAVRLADWLRQNPSQTATLKTIAKKTGASRRTLERLFRAEVGMTLCQWRRRLRLLHALKFLASGVPVTTVAFEVGYTSTSAFIGMFRRELGTTPYRYYATDASTV